MQQGSCIGVVDDRGAVQLQLAVDVPEADRVARLQPGKPSCRSVQAGVTLGALLVGMHALHVTAPTPRQFVHSEVVERNDVGRRIENARLDLLGADPVGEHGSVEQREVRHQPTVLELVHLETPDQ